MAPEIRSHFVGADSTMTIGLKPFTALCITFDHESKPEVPNLFWTTAPLQEKKKIPTPPLP
jgi:hypothetical protein